MINFYSCDTLVGFLGRIIYTSAIKPTLSGRITMTEQVAAQLLYWEDFNGVQNKQDWILFYYYFLTFPIYFGMFGQARTLFKQKNVKCDFQNEVLWIFKGSLKYLREWKNTKKWAGYRGYRQICFRSPKSPIWQHDTKPKLWKQVLVTLP